MFGIYCPSAEAESTFKACAVRTRDPALRADLLAEGPRITSRALDYKTHAEEKRLFELAADDPIHTKKELLEEVYDRVLVSGGERPKYDRLLAAAKHGRCPYCGQRDARTLDHYLPKGAYPEFAVFFPNLVPCCFDCNHTKHKHVPKTHETQLFHPYFDDWGNQTILKANVVVGAAAVNVAFLISQPCGLSSLEFTRAQFHFSKLKLGELYSPLAAIELVQKKPWFRRTFEDGGASLLQAELAQEAKDRSLPFCNSWQSALYGGLAECPDFYEGGFEEIEE